MKITLMLGMALLLGACNGQPTNGQQEAAWALSAQDAVRAHLRDGQSAEFRGTFIEHWGGAPVLCGEVNAKNGFGGLAGFQRFYFRDGAPVGMEEAVDHEQFARDWFKFCNRRS